MVRARFKGELVTARPSWSSYFLDIARVTATRATCPRLSVGCVLVLDNRILASGFNGPLAGEAHCTDVGCFMVDGHCSKSVHAEVNAVAQAARAGVPIEGATAYVTHRPCWPCAKVMFAAGVVEFRWAEDYGGGWPASSMILVKDGTAYVVSK